MNQASSIRDPFLASAAVLLGFKRRLALALIAAVGTGLCFGGGLGMVLPTLHLLLGQQRPLPEVIREQLGHSDQPLFVQTIAAWVAGQVPAEPFHAFLLVMMIVLAFTILGSIGRYTHELLTLTVVARTMMVWRDRMFRHLIQARMDRMLVDGSSDYISRISFDTTVLSGGYQAFLGKALAKVLNGAAALGLALWLDWRLTLIALTGAPLTVLLLRRFGKRIRRASRRLLQHRSYLIAVLTEVLGSIRVVKVHHAEGYERRRFSRINRSVYNEEMRMRQARALSSPVIETLGLCGIVLIASIAAWYIFRLNVPPARFMTVLIALGAATATLKPLSSLNNKLQEARSAAARIMAVETVAIEPVTHRSDPSARSLARHGQMISFDQVSFTYPGQSTPAVDNVTLRAPHGQSLAIVGANGSGKTTLLSLLPRLLEPCSGRILIDGVDTSTVSLRSLRRQIAVVTQQSILFEATVAANISYGRLNEPMEQIIAAAKAAHAHDFIMDLPKGYETMLGPGGEGVSGGERQRLCIARAILRDPAILILDEATSQIDADSELKINEALNELRHGRTTFVIAHRLSTVIEADQIAIMADGRIIDHGTHNELLDGCECYRKLTQSQLQTVAVS